MTDRTLWSTESPKTIDHKLNSISELNVIPAIQWKSKIVLASTIGGRQAVDSFFLINEHKKEPWELNDLMADFSDDNTIGGCEYCKSPIGSN